MIAIVKYNAGNICSVVNALDRLEAKYVITDKKSELLEADKIIFPGVGAAKSAMESLKEKGLDLVLPKLKQPFLGICLGMQLLLSESEEGKTKTLGIINSRIKLFPENKGYKIPQVGWNEVDIIKDDPLFYNIKNKSYFYFVHSYYAPKTEETIACTDYDDIIFSSAVKKDNFYGVQFHPEKSGEIGERLLSNFLKEVRC